MSRERISRMRGSIVWPHDMGGLDNNNYNIMSITTVRPFTTTGVGLLILVPIAPIDSRLLLLK